MSETFEIIIEGLIDGQKVTPKTIDIGLFKEYMSDVTSLLKRTEKGQSDEKVYFQIEDGSLKIKIISALFFIPSLSMDLSRLKATGILNEISSKRAEIFQKWQNNSKKNESLSFNFLHNGNSLFKIDKSSSFKTDYSKYVSVEKVLYGVITDLGGKNNPNIHLDTENGSITIYCTKEDLIDQDKRLYHDAAIKVKINQHLSTFEFEGSFQFVEFIPYKGPLKGKDLENFINQHSKYWENIPDSAEWQRKLRDGKGF